MKRQRGRGRRNNNHGNSNRSMESNGPDVKVRGTAKQIFDKYESLARDAASSGNRVKAENCRQHAEHYLRIVNAIEAAKQAARDEAEISRSEQSSAEGSDDNSTSDTERPEDGRSRRRYPPQARRSKTESDTAEMTEDDSSPADENPAREDEPVKKSSRRRRAPSRGDSSEESEIEAAE